MLDIESSCPGERETRAEMSTLLYHIYRRARATLIYADYGRALFIHEPHFKFLTPRTHARHAAADDAAA